MDEENHRPAIYDSILELMRCQLDVNHRPGVFNRCALFLVGFNDYHLQILEEEVERISLDIGRPTAFVDLEGRPFKDIALDVMDIKCCANYQAEELIKDWIQTNNGYLVIKRMSRMKTKLRGGPILYIHSLIKTMEATVVERGLAQGDLIFIDYASALERGWDEIGPYVLFNVMPLSINNLAEVTFIRSMADDIPIIG